MLPAYTVLAIVTAVVLVISAGMKFTHNEKAIAMIHVRLGVPRGWFPFLGACEAVGAAGLLVGTGVAWIGVVTAAGLTLYFIGAVLAHLRVDDTAGLSAPAPLLGASFVALVLRLLAP